MKQNPSKTESSASCGPSAACGLAARLLSWYDARRRILPWREDPTPYHVWLSEIMLQQTRVEAVLGYYDRFLTALPTIEALASADEDTCLKLWEGLGYYSRVRNLRKAAIQITSEHQGQMPRTSASLQKLAGIGPYTAAAIASICFGERIPALDGNLLRVFARMTGYDASIKDAAAVRSARDWYLTIFPETMPSGSDSQKPSPVRPNPCGDMNQALMDLGATVCLPGGRPLCEQCPWANACTACAQDRQMELPIIPRKKPRTIEEKTVFLIYYGQKLALRKRPSGGLLAGLYEFPNAAGALSREEAIEYVSSLGFSAVRLKPLPAAKHVFSHREWHMTGWQVLADEYRDFPGHDGHEAGTPAASDSRRTAGSPAPGRIFLAAAEELDKVYSIPSAFAKYQSEIRRDFL